MIAEILVGPRLPDGSRPFEVRQSNGVNIPDALRPRAVSSLAEVTQLLEAINSLGAGDAAVRFRTGGEALAHN